VIKADEYWPKVWIKDVNSGFVGLLRVTVTPRSHMSKHQMQNLSSWLNRDIALDLNVYVNVCVCVSVQDINICAILLPEKLRLRGTCTL
jgi:hypothetical protein